MKEVELPRAGLSLETSTFVACLAAILELSLDELPRPAAGEDPATGWTLSRWLGGLGLGLAPVADAGTFSWAGPWIARVGRQGSAKSRFVVMYGVPSGIVWDPAGDGWDPAEDGGASAGDGWDPAEDGAGALEGDSIEAGYVVAAADVALALPPRPPAPVSAGLVEAICIAGAAGQPAQRLQSVRAIAGRGLEGDRHVAGKGTFPSGPPGSALTMIEAEVCESFEPPLTPHQHRRNVVTRGIALNGLVGRDFTIGVVQCRGMRLCEPCTVVQGYAARPVLRALVHRGGLRVDILADGLIRVGDEVRVS